MDNLKQFFKLSHDMDKVERKITQLEDRIYEISEKYTVSDRVKGSDHDFLTERRFTVTGKPVARIRKIQTEILELREKRIQLEIQMDAIRKNLMSIPI